MKTFVLRVILMSLCIIALFVAGWAVRGFDTPFAEMFNEVGAVVIILWIALIGLLLLCSDLSFLLRFVKRKSYFYTFNNKDYEQAIKELAVFAKLYAPRMREELYKPYKEISVGIAGFWNITIRNNGDMYFEHDAEYYRIHLNIDGTITCNYRALKPNENLDETTECLLDNTIKRWSRIRGRFMEELNDRLHKTDLSEFKAALPN